MSSSTSPASGPTGSSMPPVHPTQMPRRVSFGTMPQRPLNSQQYVPVERTKSMSDIDKEEEARMTKSYKEKAKWSVAGVMDRLEKKLKGDGAKKA
ncbi:hypothetical protein OPT61_g2647 [Boeremia exigua]|uniref:Uncharacterized protein n=1 Tax=Boeremia exigua TaxID=749465 RepID=A0ACC2IKR4_9PLEO|nr:hypothetical protein OPT61_g2647 [Boeremia exigua]